MKLKLICVYIATMLALMSCTPVDDSEYIAPLDPPYPIDAFGVTFEQSPLKVGSLSPIITTLMYELGYRDYQVVFSDVCDTVNIEDEQRAGTPIEPDLQTIAQLDPEVVFTFLPLNEQDTLAFESANVELIVLNNPKTIDELHGYALDLIAMMEGQLLFDINAPVYQNNFDSMMSQYENTGKSFLYVVDSDGIFATPDTFESDVLSVFGENAIVSYSNYTLPTEIIDDILENSPPDIIFYNNSLSSESVQELVGEGFNLVPIDPITFKLISNNLNELLDYTEQLF